MKYVMENINSEPVLHVEKEITHTAFLFFEKYLDYITFEVTFDVYSNIGLISRSLRPNFADMCL